MRASKTPSWRTLTPGQRALLRRMRQEGGLFALRPWEMSTVRSLLARGLVRPRNRARGDQGGLWFLTALGARIVPEPDLEPVSEDAAGPSGA